MLEKYIIIFFLARFQGMMWSTSKILVHFNSDTSLPYSCVQEHCSAITFCIAQIMQGALHRNGC